MCFPSLTVCSTLPFPHKTLLTQTCKFTCEYLIFLDQDTSPANVALQWIDSPSRYGFSQTDNVYKPRRLPVIDTRPYGYCFRRGWVRYPAEFESPTTDVGTTMHFPVFSRTPNWPSLTVSYPQCWTSCLFNEHRSVSNGCAYLPTLEMTTDCWKHG